MNKKEEMIKAVMADEAFVKSCIEAESEEAVQKLFADKGVEMSLTEIELMKEAAETIVNGNFSEEMLEKMANGGELDEAELESAAGGVLTPGDPGAVLKPLSGSAEGKLANQLAGIANGSNAGAIAGGIIGGLVVVGTIGCAIYKYKDEIGEGISTGYNWVKKNISRW